MQHLCSVDCQTQQQKHFMNRNAFSLITLSVISILTVWAFATGSPEVQKFSALTLLPISVLAIFIFRIPIKSLFPKNPLRNYFIAISYPLVIMIVLTALTFLAGEFATKDESIARVAMVISINSFFGILAALLTEELFFRGVCWHLLEKQHYSPWRINLITSIIFTAWHLPIGFYEFGAFDKAHLPVYFLNAFLLSINWGILRAASGSILITSVCHALWNGLTYKLFGFGDKSGFFLSSFYTFDAERGWLGIPLNLISAVVLYRILKKMN